MRLLLACLIVATAGDALAQPPGASRPAARRSADPPRRKSPALALGLGVGITAVGGLALGADLANPTDGPHLGLPGVLAMYMGPGIGRWVGGGSAAIGLLSRGFGGAFIIAAIKEDIDHPFEECVPDPSEGEDCEEADAAKAAHDRKVRRLLYTGAAIWIASSVYDFVRAPLDARDFNRAHAITVAPTALPSGNGGSLVPGLVVVGTF